VTAGRDRGAGAYQQKVASTVAQNKASGRALLALLVSAFAAGCESGDRQPPATPSSVHGSGKRCDVGAERDPGAPGAERAIVLGCGRTRAGNVVQLYSFRDAGGPCINIAGLPGGTRACGRAPSERVPPARVAIGGGEIVRRSARAALELYGETAPNVHRVLLRYRLPHGRPRHRPATLISVTDRAALTAAGIRMPFGYFVGGVPPRAREVSAAAHGRSGEVLGRLGFDRLARGMPPTVFIAGRRLADDSP
jgi:hypothetical protein